MTEEDRQMTSSRRRYLQVTGGLAAGATFGLAGCVEEQLVGTATGTLVTHVTDQPGDIGDFESCVVTIEGIWVKPEGGEGEAPPDDEVTPTPEETNNETPTPVEMNNETPTPDLPDQASGRRYIEFEEAQEADLVQLQDGETQLIDESELEVGSYQFLQLDISDVDAVLNDGSEPVDIDTPGNAPLQFKEPFEIREGQQTHFLADFIPVRRGQTGSYLIKPVAQGTEVWYEDEATPTPEETPTPEPTPTPEDTPTPE